MPMDNTNLTVSSPPIQFVSPFPLPITDIVVVALVATFLIFSIVAVFFIFNFHFSHARSERIRLLNSLWSVRVLLILFSCLWALAETLRLSHLIHLILSSHVLHVHLCRAYVLTSHAFAEPCFFATLLFLLQASMDDSLKAMNHPDAFAAALSVALITSLPLFVIHAIFVTPMASWVLCRIGLMPNMLEKVVGDMGETQDSPDAMRCSYPLFSTALLAFFGAIYVPWFVSVCWKAVTVVINKTLRIRLYALAVSVVMALSVQVVALSLTAFWHPNDAVFQGLGLIGFLAVFNCALVGQGILVVRPIRDAIEVGYCCSNNVGDDDDDIDLAT